jgi:hypothetical protein
MLHPSGRTVSAATLFLPDRRPMRRADRLLLVRWRHRGEGRDPREESSHSPDNSILLAVAVGTLRAERSTVQWSHRIGGMFPLETRFFHAASGRRRAGNYS